eukprot:c25772_g1_i1 orf=282-1967(+)
MAPSDAAAATSVNFDRINSGASSITAAHGDKAMEAWKYRPTTNGGQQNQQGSSSAGDMWITKHSHLDSQILTQALQRELSSRKEFCVRGEDKSTPKSLAETLSHCFSSQALSKMYPPPPNMDVKSQLHQNSELLRVLQGGTTSFVSTSDAKEKHSVPGSPFNNSCSNSSNTMAAGEAVDSEPTLSSVDARGYSIQASEEMNTSGLGGSASRFGTKIATKVSPGQLEKQAQTFVGKDIPSSAIPSTWVRTGCDRPQALGAQTSNAKITKRRSRASSKAPITVLSADTTNFRAMVQKLTGIPAPLMQQSSIHWWGSPSSISVLKPQPTRPTQHIQGLSTLDTSAYLLFDGASALNQDPRLFAGDFVEHGFSGLSFLPTSQVDTFLHGCTGGEHSLNVAKEPNFFSCPTAVNSDVGALLPNLLNPFEHKVLNQQSSSSSQPMPWDSTEHNTVREGFLNDILRKEYCPERVRDVSASIRLGENMNARGTALHENASNQSTHQNIIVGDKSDLDIRQVAALESLLMANERMDFDLPGKGLHAVDSWLSCDGTLVNHATKLELAHTA